MEDDNVPREGIPLSSGTTVALDRPLMIGSLGLFRNSRQRIRPPIRSQRTSRSSPHPVSASGVEE
jgi:hypothetical protein